MATEKASAKKKKVEILNVSEKRVQFLLNDSTDQEAANMRKAMLVHIPTMAVMEVDIKENTSIMYSDMIIQRLEMVLFYSMTADQFSYASECECKRQKCPKCTVGFCINVKNTDSDVPISVTTSKKYMQLLDSYAETSKGVAPLCYEGHNESELVIVELAKGQQIYLHLYVQKGSTKKFRHTKFKPVTVVAMRLDPVITIDKLMLSNLSVAQRLSIVNCCPKKVFILSETDADIIVQQPRNCSSCQECIHVSKQHYLPPIEDLGGETKQIKKQQPMLIRMEEKKNCYLFNVKCNGTLTPQKILESAFQIVFASENESKSKPA